MWHVFLRAPFINLFPAHSNPTIIRYFNDRHWIDEETEAEKEWETYAGPNTERVAELEFWLNFLETRFLAHVHCCVVIVTAASSTTGLGDAGSDD